MKKTLIALAVLAASGASFAQVSLTGNFTYGYASVTTGGANGVASTDSAGLGVDTSEINFMATEDLGGGTKATVVMGLSGADRSMEGRGNAGINTTTAYGSGVRGTNAALSLATTNGTFGLASTQSADYLSGGLAGVGAYYQGFDGKVFSSRTNRDVASYSSPVFAGGFKANISYQETSASAAQGLAVGSAGAAGVVGQNLTTWGFDYNSGPMNVNANYLIFNSKEAVGATRDQTRLSGNYDLGVVKLGLGTAISTVTGTTASATNGKIIDMAAGAVFPLGKWAIGLEFVSRKYDDFHAITGGTSGTSNGSALQVSYAMSKRTALIGNYARWTQGIATAAGAANGLGVATNQDSSSMYLLAISHSF